MLVFKVALQTSPLLLSCSNNSNFSSSSNSAAAWAISLASLQQLVVAMLLSPSQPPQPMHQQPVHQLPLVILSPKPPGPTRLHRQRVRTLLERLASNRQHSSQRTRGPSWMKTMTRHLISQLVVKSRRKRLRKS